MTCSANRLIRRGLSIRGFILTISSGDEKRVETSKAHDNTIIRIIEDWNLEAMKENRFHFWQKWLTYANVMTVGVGLLVAFAGNSFFFDLHNAGTESVFYSGNSLDINSLNLKNWLFGIIGGTIVGFHILMIMISEHAFKKKEKWAYRALWFGMLSWFVIDSGISWYYGAIYNIVLINLVALILIGLPLVMTRSAFKA